MGAGSKLLRLLLDGAHAASLRIWGNIEYMFATFRGAVNIGHIATFRGQIPNILDQHLGVRPMVPPETLEETL